jgi:AraC-like DNA-binding protein
MCFFLYPLEVIQSTISRSKIYALLFSPLLLLVFVGMCAGIEYTTIYTYADLWQHIGEFNVWFRLLTLTVMLFYCFSLFLVPYDWRKSSADKKFIMFYSCGFCLMGLLHFSIQVSHAYWLALAHQVVWMAFFVLITYFELRERLLPSESWTMPETNDGVPVSEEKGLWGRIITALDNEEKWREAGLNLNTLSDYLKSNRTYVGDAVKQHTGLTFNEYINQRRVNYMVEQLKRNPETSLPKLFAYVGYNQRTTAARNFQKITGVTPAEFIESIKQ